MATRAPAMGGCLCGATRFSVTEPPSNSFICHCKTCRRASGGMQVGWVTLKTEQLRFEGALPKVYVSSPGIRRTFCEHCGTSLTWQQEGSSEIDVTLASFDRVEDFPPGDELWTSQRPSWTLPDHRLTQWPEDFPD